MRALWVSLTIWVCLALPNPLAWAQQSGSTPGFVRLEIVPLTLSEKVLDTSLHVGFLDHPLLGGTNFHPALKEIAFPDQKIAVQDLFITGIVNEATCTEALSPLLTYYKTNALALPQLPDLAPLEVQWTAQLNQACQKTTNTLFPNFGSVIKVGLQEKCKQAVESCKEDPLNTGKTCTHIEQQCGVLSGAVETTLYPTQRIAFADVRAKGGTAAAANIGAVVVNAQAVAPYATLPLSGRQLYHVAVVGSEQFLDGLVGISLSTELTKVVLASTKNVDIDPASQFSFPVVSMEGLLHGANTTYYRFASAPAGQPPLALHSEATAYVAPDTFWDPVSKCHIPPESGKPAGTLTTITSKAQKEKGCLQEDQPIDLAVLKLFDPADAQRDVVLVNRGPVPGEPQHAFVTVYRKRLNGYPGDARFFSDLWQYAGFGRIGREPYDSCVMPLADGREGLLVTGKEKVTLIRGLTDLNTKESQIVTIPIPVNPGEGWSDYQSFHVACGDFNHDTIPDFAVTWARLPTLEQPFGDFAPFVSIYHGLGNNNFAAGPTVQAPPIQEDGDSVPTAIKAEYMTLTSCDLDRNNIDDLCVGDQYPYTIKGQKEVYALYFPLQLNGTVDPDKTQRLRVNTRADYLTTPGRGGVRVISEDRFNNMAFNLGDPTFHRTPVTFYCTEDFKTEDPLDQVPSSPYGMLIGGEVVFPDKLSEKQQQLLQEKCDIDNCKFTANPDQKNTDGDGEGDACDHDDDNDGLVDGIDYCPLVPNPTNADQDKDFVGDVCDECPAVKGKVDNHGCP